jgi:hypothetical protein
LLAAVVARPQRPFYLLRLSRTRERAVELRRDALPHHKRPIAPHASPHRLDALRASRTSRPRQFDGLLANAALALCADDGAALVRTPRQPLAKLQRPAATGALKPLCVDQLWLAFRPGRPQDAKPGERELDDERSEIICFLPGLASHDRANT